VSRALSPQLPEYLYALSAGDGADGTRAQDTGSSPVRNGEPEGELGLVKQSDFAWRDQTGSPDDVQPGNIPGGSRDVLSTASFKRRHHQQLCRGQRDLRSERRPPVGGSSLQRR